LDDLLFDHAEDLRERKARATRRPLEADTPTGHAIAQLQTLRGIGLMGAFNCPLAVSEDGDDSRGGPAETAGGLMARCCGRA
jgi:hypothetical protein